MAKKNSLQMFTNTDSKINLILQKKKVLPADIKGVFTEKEQPQFSNYLQKQLNELKDTELDDFIEQIFEIIPENVKNQLWENNHYTITNAISLLMEESGRMPTRNAIAAKTGLSRQTIGKHLKEFATNPHNEYEKLKFKVMSDRVLAKVFKIAVKDAGNVRAARLYLEVMGLIGNQSTESPKINTQNNYIQINGTVLSQETIKQLSTEKLNQIETILKS